ncbi:MAG: glycine zipper domain-containing protein [Tepidisphaeraceae bacterium]|jgi:surface antigen
MIGSPRALTAAALTITIGLYSAGCETKAETGALVGGAGGAAVGAGVGSLSHSRAGEGALIGGAVGAVGGYIVGNEMDKKDQRDRDRASDRATREGAYDSQRVTRAQVIQWNQQGVKDEIIIDRIQRSGAKLRSNDESALRDAGISEDVVRAMKDNAK